jgi:endonuclease/exonuclease/phosphatase family metal-dependent hydrolase
MVNEKHPLVKERYQIIQGALEKCIQDPESELSYSKQTYIDHKHQSNFYSLLEAAVQKGQKLILPINNRWDHRIVAIRETIKKTMSFAPHAPYFLALQEVTPRALEDLKKQFPDLQWVSYNTTTAKETRVHGEEEVLGEFLSFTATLALSAELQIIRIDHATLPSVSGSLRRILGVEVYYPKLKRHLAIFTLHTDYLVKDHLYERNVKVISEFVHKFAGQLPFVFGGDLNAFERHGGEEYIQSLKTSKPFEGSVDYREGPFYSSPAIAYSTFIGHVLDSFKEALVETNGSLTVHPNALDHIFLKKLEILFSLREAGVFNEDGHVIDAFLDPDTYIKRLTQRNTASDHFLNAVLFRFEK